MDYLNFLADHVDEGGVLTKSISSCDLGIVFHGRNVQAALINNYNYGEIEVLGLKEGPAPKSYKDLASLRSQREEEEKKELDKLCKEGRSPGYGFACADDIDFEFSEEYGFHWVMLEDLLAMDFQRLVCDVRDILNWEKLIEERGIEHVRSLCTPKTLEEFMGEDFITQMRNLVSDGYSRITFWAY